MMTNCCISIRVDPTNVIKGESDPLLVACVSNGSSRYADIVYILILKQWRQGRIHKSSFLPANPFLNLLSCSIYTFFYFLCPKLGVDFRESPSVFQRTSRPQMRICQSWHLLFIRPCQIPNIPHRDWQYHPACSDPNCKGH